MRRGLTILVALAALSPLFWACSRVEVADQDEAAAEELTAEEPSVILTSANVYLDEETAALFAQAEKSGVAKTRSAAVNDVFDRLGIVSVERLFPDAGEFEERTREAGLHRWYKVTYGEPHAVTKARSAFESMPGLQLYEPVRSLRVQTDFIFDDPTLPNQWHYYNDGSRIGYTAGADVDVFPVWQNYTTGSPSVVVAVVDGGVDPNHVDLAANFDANNSYNTIHNSSVIVADEHGTHVAGTIAAVNNNGIGVSGLAGGNAAAGVQGSKILSCQIFQGDSQGDEARAIKWAADHGAVIANNSWGFNFWDKDHTQYDVTSAKALQELFDQPNEGSYKHSLKEAIDYFNNNAGMKSGNQVGPMAGGLVLFAAGNDTQPYGPPANYPGVLAVGAIGPDGSRASYSNYGDWVDIAAPGTNVFSTIPNNAYASLSGTSMACPHVSGVAALVVAACGGPGFTREMLIERLLGGVNTKIKPSQIGGLVDALGAIQYGDDSVPAQVKDLTATATSNQVTASWSVTGKSTIPAAGFIVMCSSDKSALESSTPGSPASGVSSRTYKVTTEKVGTKVSLTLDLDFETTYYVRVFAYFSNLIYSTPSATASATTAANNAPVITPRQSMDGIVLRATGTATYGFDIADPDGHSFTVTQSKGSDAETWGPSQGGYSVTIKAQVVDPGTYTSTITATDSFGKPGSYSFSYTILENAAPVAKGTIPNTILHSSGETFTATLSDYFEDPDGDNLSYTAASSAPSSMFAAANSGKLTITMLSYGKASITVTASDPKGKKATQTFEVLGRQAGIDATAYPNPVTDYLNIATGATEENVSVTMVSAGGAVVYDGTVKASAFNPARIDMRGVAPGRYKLTLDFGSKTEEMQIVKK